MNEALLELVGLAPAVLFPTFLVFLRVGTAMMMLPVFGEMLIPQRVRLALAMAFTLVTVSAILPEIASDPALNRSPYALGAAEVATGLAIGFSFRLLLMALQVAASIAAQSTSLSQLLGGASVDPQPAIGVVLLLAALALAATMGLHVQFSMMFIYSYTHIGVGEVLSSGALASWAAGAVSSTFGFAFALAAPFIAVSLLYNLALGVINRAMPQLMVAFVGAPAITFGALVLLALTSPLILSVWADQFQHLIRTPFGSR